MSEDSILHAKPGANLAGNPRLALMRGLENILSGTKVVSGKDRDVSYTYRIRCWPDAVSNSAEE
jgi:hypothetical protein